MSVQNALSPNAHNSGASGSDLEFLWLEITGKCNLECVHCYAESSPRGTHGSMCLDDWFRVLEEAANLGCKRVQFIGGEPTLHPDFAAMVRKAKEYGLGIDVYSNLVTVPDRLWDLFQECNVDLSTSFYSDDPAVQDRITQRSGSQKNTLHNITEASARGYKVRVGLIAINPDQDIDKTIGLLESRHVRSVGTDHLREVGRGQKKVANNVDALCGNCSASVASINPNGQVYPCPLSRWLPVGNVREEGLASILNGVTFKGTKSFLDNAFSLRPEPRKGENRCVPQSCRPQGCGPNSCKPQLLEPQGGA